MGQELLPGLVPSREPAAYNCLFSSKCAFLSLLLPLASISPWLHLTTQYLFCASLSAHRLSLLSYLQAPPMLCCLFLPRTTRPHCIDHVHPCLGGWGSLCPPQFTAKPFLLSSREEMGTGGPQGWEGEGSRRPPQGSPATASPLPAACLRAVSTGAAWWLCWALATAWPSTSTSAA